MTSVMSCPTEGALLTPKRRWTKLCRSRVIGSALYHSKPIAILIVATLVLFRTWIGSRSPGGTDSAFLYSGVAFYRTHGLQLFTVWLPSPLGQVSQYSMYWLISMLTAVFQGTLLTYKLIAVSIAFMSGIGMYAISWSWSRSRAGALAAAVFYSFSPMSIAQWLSGHLDVQLSMAVGPIVIWSICRLIDTGSRRAAVGLGLCASALLLLTTGQAAYWILPAVVIIASRLPISFRKATRVIRRALPGAVLTVAVFAAASAVQLFVWLFGVHAAFIGSQDLAIELLTIHEKYSLAFGPGIIGVPGETWLLPGSNLSFTSFTSLLYILPEIAVVLFATWSVFVRKSSLPRIFFVLAVFAWLLESGPHGPVGDAYVFVWQHVLFFRELRVPGRWQMISSFAVAIMLALSIAEMASRGSGWQFKWQHMMQPGRRAKRKFSGAYTLRRLQPLAVRNNQWRAGKTVGYFGLLILMAGTLLTINAGTIFARGLPTINPPHSYVSTYSALARSPGDWRVLTVPFGQGWMGGPIYGDYEGIAADLGYTSPLYDGRNVLGNGGWDPRGSQFVTFLEDVINQGVDRHLASLLGEAGVKYIVSSPEPAIEVPSGQMNFLRREHDFKLLRSGYGMTVLENSLAQPQASQPRTACVIAGGYSVLEDLTEQPAFNFRNTAVYFADQVVKTSGWSTLVRIIELDHCLIMGPGAAGELAVLRNSTASVQATSISSSQWPSGPISPLLDSQADPAQWVSIPAGHRLAWKVDVPSAGSYRIWVRIMRGTNTASVPVTVNGVPAGSIAPTLPATLGFQWLPARVIRLSKGPARVILRGTSRGTSPQVAEIALVHAGNGQNEIVPGVKRNWVIVDRSPLDADLYSHPRIEWSNPIISSQWQRLPGVKATRERNGMVTFSPTAARRLKFAMAYALLPRSINPKEPLAFEFRGAGTGATFYLNFYFKDHSEKSVSFVDTSSSRKALFFTLQNGRAARSTIGPAVENPYVTSPPLQVPDWSGLKYLTLSSNSRNWQGGTVRIAGPFPMKLSHSLPYFAGHFPSADRSEPAIGAKLGTPFVSTTTGLHGLRPGILDFAQSYNPGWHLTGADADVHTVELGFQNSYLVRSGGSHARLNYGPAAIGMWGTIVSLVAWSLGLVILIAWPLGTSVLRHRRRTRSVDTGSTVLAETQRTDPSRPTVV
jgi:hypothetical protein